MQQDSHPKPDSKPAPLQTSSASAFVFTSKRYSAKEENMSWLMKKPLLSRDKLHLHANGAVDLGPFATTIPGFTPLSLLQPSSSVEPPTPLIASPPSPQLLSRDPSLPETLKVKPPTGTFRSRRESNASPIESPSVSNLTAKPPASGAGAPWNSVVVPPRPQRYTMSLSELIVNDPTELKTSAAMDIFPQPARPKRRNKNTSREKKAKLDKVLVLAKQVDKYVAEDELNLEDDEVILSPIKPEFSKASEKTRRGLKTTHDCHAKLTTT